MTDEEAKKILKLTLKKMKKSGLFDEIGKK